MVFLPNLSHQRDSTVLYVTVFKKNPIVTLYVILYPVTKTVTVTLYFLACGNDNNGNGIFSVTI